MTIILGCDNIKKQEDFVAEHDGKYIQGYIVDPKNKKRKAGFVLAKQDGLRQLAQMALTSGEYRVLLFLMGVLDYDNYLCISQQDVGNALGMSRQHVSKTINGLVEREIILRGEAIGRQNTYRVNNDFFEKGKPQNVSKAVSSARAAARDKGSGDRDV